MIFYSQRIGDQTVLPPDRHQFFARAGDRVSKGSIIGQHIISNQQIQQPLERKAHATWNMTSQTSHMSLLIFASPAAARIAERDPESGRP